jgi:hypothetical protein
LEYPLGEASSKPDSSAVEMTTSKVIPDVTSTHHSVDEIRELPMQEISNRLERVLIQVSSTGPTQLQAPIDVNIPLIGLGLDSMTVVQFKGVLENRYVCIQLFYKILVVFLLNITSIVKISL